MRLRSFGRADLSTTDECGQTGKTQDRGTKNFHRITPDAVHRRNGCNEWTAQKVGSPDMSYQALYPFGGMSVAIWSKLNV